MGSVHILPPVFETRKAVRPGGPVRRVMVVEDEAVVGMDIVGILERQGYEVAGPFGDVESAMTAMKESAPHYAVLDIRLGSEHSLLIADVLTAQCIPFFWISACDPNLLPPQHRTRPFVAKPFLGGQVLAALGELICAGK
jgi:CheY-like chemotaxis protein